MFQLNGQPISIDNPFTTEDGVTYPHLRDPAVRTLLGVVEVADEPWYDQRFYWGVDNPKDLDQLKAQWISQTKQNANAQLTQTDWMVTRKVERNIDIPEDVSTARVAILQTASDMETAITEATTVEELMVAVGVVPSAAPAPVEVVLATESIEAISSQQLTAL